MKKLKEIYMHNSIVQFIVSYILVMLLPLLICSIGAQISFRVVEEDVKTSKMNVLNHSKSVIDSNLKQIHTLALQVSRNEKVQKVAENNHSTNADFYMNAKDAINQIENIIKFKTANLLKNVAVYYQRSDYYMVDGSLYQGEFYYNKILKSNTLGIAEWKRLYGGMDYQKAFYQRDAGNFQWIQPIIGEDGLPLDGGVICNLDMSYFNSLFIDSEKNVGLFIQDEEGDILYSVNRGVNVPDFISLNLSDKQGFIDIGDDMLIYTTSELDGWKYIMVVKQKQVMQRLNQLKFNEYLLILVAIGIGVGLACYTSIRQGKPINEIFNVYITNADMERNSKNLGGMVSEIVMDNRQLMEEIEKEKPLLRYAFLYKIIRSEFSSKRELTMLADKVNCKVDAKSYRVMAFRLFGNNDFYETDSQTFEEVQIIFHYLQSKLRNYMKEDVWFYEIDYLTQLVILPCYVTEQKPDDIVSYVREDITREYKVNPLWGVSNACTDILELWRACEEAKAALAFTSESKNLVYYNDIMTEQTGFYYPELFEERLIGSVQSSDSVHIKNLLELSKKENFELRKLTRGKFLKLNNRFSNTLISLDKSEEIMDGIEALNNLAIHFGEEPIDKYYDLLYQIFTSASTELHQYKISKRTRLTEKIKTYVDNHYADSNLGLALVGTEYNISEGYVSTLFKEQAGINFADYVEKLRIDKACILLKENKLTIVQISELVGYNSIQSFRRAFKKVKGVSPSKLREK